MQLDFDQTVNNEPRVILKIFRIFIFPFKVVRIFNLKKPFTSGSEEENLDLSRG